MSATNMLRRTHCTQCSGTALGMQPRSGISCQPPAPSLKHSHTRSTHMNPTHNADRYLASMERYQGALDELRCHDADEFTGLKIK